MITLAGAERLRALARELDGMGRRLADRKALHRAMGGALRVWIDRNFQAEGRLGAGSPAGWPPLAPATVAARRRRGRGRRILEDTGRLRRGFRMTVGAEQVRLFNPVPYAARHQHGLGVPRRPFLPGTSQARRIVHPVVERFIEEARP